MKNRGVILVLLLLAAGLAAAATAIWHQYRQTRRALDFWGPQAAYLIGHAPVVTLDKLQPALQKQTPLTVQSHRDISQARGLVHFRRSLLEDENFDWEGVPSADPEGWDYRVAFSDGNEIAAIMFDLDRKVVGLESPEGYQARLTSRMTEGIAHFLDETLADTAESTGRNDEHRNQNRDPTE